MPEAKQIQGNLGSPAIQASVGLLVNDLVLQISPLEAYDLLQELQQSMSYAQLDEQTSKFYRKQLNLLKFGTFSFLTGEEQQRLLQNSVVTALKAGADVRGHIEHIFLPNFLGKIHEQKVRSLTQSLESSTEKLGQNPINVGGQVSPEVKNWLLDFKNFSGGKTGAYEIVNYLTNNQNAKSLSTDDREVLRNLLVLYRFLKYEAVPDNYLEPASLTEEPAEGEEQSAAQAPAVPARQPTPRPVQAKTVPRRPLEQRATAPVFTQKAQSRSAPHGSPTVVRRQPVTAQTEKKFTQDYQALSSLPKKEQPSTQAKRNLDKLTGDFSEEPVSLSGSLINHGSDSGDEVHGMRPGKKESKEEQSVAAPASEKGNAQVQSNALPTSAAPAASEELLSVLQKAGTAPAPKQINNDTERPAVSSQVAATEEQKQDSGVIDLKQNTPTDLSTVREPLQLAKIKLSDLRKNGLEQSLEVVKQKILDFSQKHELSAKQIAGYFFRSPAHSHYTNTVVAITNDSSGDQRTAFEKLNKQLEASGKEHLSREEFLAFHKFKKELNAQ